MEKPEAEKKKKISEEILIEGCISEDARSEISNMLERRLAELDPTGLQAKFVIKLREEIQELPDCEEMLEGKPADASASEEQ